MAIFKAVVHSEYAQIPNATLQDKTLTFEARGLLAMMLSLPDDWEIHKSWLQEQAVNCGRDKLTRLMKELQDSGYVRKQMNHRDDGRFSDVDWFVYPTAQLETRSTANPSDGKPATTKETSKQTNNNTNISAPTGAPVSDLLTNQAPEQPAPKKPAKSAEIEQLQKAFDVFWQAGMKKANKAKAEKAFMSQYKAAKPSLSSDDKPNEFAQYLVRDIQKRISSGQFGFDRMLPTTYLNGQRWHDDHEKPAANKPPAIDDNDTSWVNGVFDKDFM